jgi:PAS domain S-box-containing protein
LEESLVSVPAPGPEIPPEIPIAYHHLVDLLPNSFLCCFDRQLRVVFASGSLQNNFAYTAKEAIGRSVQDLLPRVAWTVVEPHLRAALVGESSKFALTLPAGAILQLLIAPNTENARSDVSSEALVIMLGVASADRAQSGETGSGSGSAGMITDSERLAAVVQATGVGLWEWDMIAQQVHFSVEWKQQLGYEDAEIGDDFDEWVRRLHPEDRERAVQAVAGYVGGAGGVYRQTFRLRHKDGSYRHILAQGALYCDAGGQPVRMFGSHTDVTPAVAGEQALRESEARYRGLFENSRSVMLLVDPDSGAILDANAAAAAYYGWSRERIRAMNIYAINAATRGDVQAEMERAQREQRSHFLFTHRLADGSLRDVEVFSGPVMVEGHRLLYSIVHDVTERRRTEEALRQSEAKLRDKAEQLAQVMLSAPEGVLLLDNRNHVLLTNKRADTKLALLATFDTERRLAQLGGMDLDMLLTTPPEGQWHTLQAGPHIYELIARPVESGPVPAGWVMILREVTAERTVQEQLQRQERLAAVGQLAAGIAHDFNNIMSVISIYAEMTSEAPGLTAKERARTLTIIEQAQRATRMIRQILDFSRQSVLERQIMDLLPLLKEQEKLLKQTLPENVEIMLEAPRGEYFVLADPTRMQQLVMNLAVNARDAMPEGGQLQIRLSKLTITDGKHSPVTGLGERDWVRIDVQDSGTGIRPEHMAHIFEPFFTTKEPGKGTGLGLAQTHGIVAQHAGHIIVTSEPGEGTTFSIFLPTQPLAHDAAGAALLRADLPLGQSERVLLVEDDPTLRDSLAELMALWNYQVVTAANGEEALAQLAEQSRRQDEPFALIVSDVVMPRLGGVALVKALRKSGSTTPVILMSGHPIGEEQAPWQELGVEVLLMKPPNSRQLAEAMAQVLRRPSSSL